MKDESDISFLNLVAKTFATTFEQSKSEKATNTE